MRTCPNRITRNRAGKIHQYGPGDHGPSAGSSQMISDRDCPAVISLLLHLFPSNWSFAESWLDPASISTSIKPNKVLNQEKRSDKRKEWFLKSKITSCTSSPTNRFYAKIRTKNMIKYIMNRWALQCSPLLRRSNHP